VSTEYYFSLRKVFKVNTNVLMFSIVFSANMLILSPIDLAISCSASLAPRFAASITPVPPPEITEISFLAKAFANLYELIYSQLSIFAFEPPKIEIAFPIFFNKNFPLTTSSPIL